MPSISPESSDKNSAYRLIHDVYVLLDYGDRLVLDRFKLTPTQFRLLNLIDTDQGQRLTTLSNRVLRSKSQITRIIDALEKEGLVRRVNDDTDRRAQLIVLTQSGEKLRDEVNFEHAKSLNARFGTLDSAEQESLVRLLHKLQHGMSKYLELV